ncbi:DNA adenine methylase, partial [Sphingomonas trueperi]|uniref:DNA adenine methylase n=1 Tax=Sphingomonas trueperi TaxID=53317 RepID=UPI0031DFA1A5
MSQPFFKWMGGKRRLAKHILPNFPDHQCYVEPFAGGAALFFMKEPSKIEVINDTNSDLVNLYRVVQHHLVQGIAAAHQGAMGAFSQGGNQFVAVDGDLAGAGNAGGVRLAGIAHLSPQRRGNGFVLFVVGAIAAPVDLQGFPRLPAGIDAQ